MKLLIDIPEHIYEHAKETTEDSRDEFDAMRAIANGTQQESRSEIPNTCGDAISRNNVIDTLNNMHRYIADELTLCSTGKKFEGNEVFIVDDVYEEIAENLPSINSQSIKCGDAISRQEALNAITMAEVRWQAVDNVNKLPPVTPQQRTGRWIIKDGKEQGYDIAGVKTWYIQIMCNKCGHNDAEEMEGIRDRLIKRLLKKNKDYEWIPVSERLPEDKTYVLTTIKTPNRIAHARSGWYQNGFFHNDNGDTWRATDIEVTAWMPLPQPYKAESEDKE